MYIEGKLIYFDPDDQCNTCNYNAVNGIVCPLLEALMVGVASWEEPGAAVLNCGFYSKKERHLRVVKDDEGVGDDKHDDPTPGR